MEKILPISPKINFTPNTSGCYGLISTTGFGPFSPPPEVPPFSVSNVAIFPSTTLHSCSHRTSLAPTWQASKGDENFCQECPADTE